jgi:hypothetical protein
MPKTDTVPAEVANMEAAADEFAPIANVLRGDLRDAMLNQLRNATDFSKLDEARQRDIASAIDFAATEFTVRAVRLLASEGKTQVQAKLDQITVKDGLKIVCSGGFTHDALVLLGEAQGKQVLITVADAEPFDGQRAEAQVDPDQTTLLGDDSDLVDAADPPAEQEPFDAGDEELAGN